MRITVKPPKGDATAAVQAAIDRIAMCDKRGVPNSGAVTHQATRPNGGSVYLPAGTYTFGKPLKQYGMVNVVGDGRDTFCDFPDSDAFDLAGVDLSGSKDFYNLWSGVRDLAIRCKGDAFSSSTAGTISPRIERVQVTCGGWFVILPILPKHQCYVQDAIIRECHHIDPGAGSILIRGNCNLVDRVYVSNGARPGFRSPWEEAELAMIDVGGTGNVVTGNHVEFSAPHDVGVVSYAFRGRAADMPGTVYASDNWHEVPFPCFAKAGASTLIDNCAARGHFGEDVGGVVSVINKGSVNGRKAGN